MEVSEGTNGAAAKNPVLLPRGPDHTLHLENLLAPLSGSVV